MRADGPTGAGSSGPAVATRPRALGYADLAAQCGPRPTVPRGRILTIEGLGAGEIAYNPSRPFELFAPALGRTVRVMYVRVESRSSAAVNRLLTTDGSVPSGGGAYDPRSVLYEQVDEDRWVPADYRRLGLPPTSFVFEGLEDPFVCSVGTDLIVGGVIIDFSTAVAVNEPIPIAHASRFDYSLATTTVTVQLRRGPTLADLAPFATIRGMREVRLLQLSDESVFVATRPHGGAAGLGTMGFTRIPTLDDLTQDIVDAAPLMPWVITPDVKTGPNDLHLVRGSTPADDQVGVLGHAAFRDTRFDLHYLATAFRVLNPFAVPAAAAQVSDPKVLACRHDWPLAGVKRPTLEDVVFPTSLVASDGQMVLQAGVSDAAIGELVIPAPFGP